MASSEGHAWNQIPAWVPVPENESGDNDFMRREFLSVMRSPQLQNLDIQSILTPFWEIHKPLALRTLIKIVYLNTALRDSYLTLLRFLGSKGRKNSKEDIETLIASSSSPYKKIANWLGAPEKVHEFMDAYNVTLSDCILSIGERNIFPTVDRERDKLIGQFMPSSAALKIALRGSELTDDQWRNVARTTASIQRRLTSMGSNQKGLTVFSLTFAERLSTFPENSEEHENVAYILANPGFHQKLGRCGISGYPLLYINKLRQRVIEGWDDKQVKACLAKDLYFSETVLNFPRPYSIPQNFYAEAHKLGLELNQYLLLQYIDGYDAGA